MVHGIRTFGEEGKNTSLQRDMRVRPDAVRRKDAKYKRLKVTKRPLKGLVNERAEYDALFISVIKKSRRSVVSTISSKAFIDVNLGF